MPPVINFKICDNSAECSAISSCSQGVFSWDNKNKIIKIENSKCTGCGACENNFSIQSCRILKSQSEMDFTLGEISILATKISD